MLAKLFGHRWEWGLLVARVVLGVIFIAHGYQKLFVMGVETVAGFFARIGIPAPGLFAWVVTLWELLGGLAVLVGVLTRWAALGLAVIMVVATLTVKLEVGLIAPPGRGTGYELDLALLALALMLVLAGPGKLSVEGDVLKREL